MAVPAIEVGYTHTSVTSVNTEISIAEPSGVQVGDLLIYIVGNERNVDTAQWDNSTLKPSGFTFINTAGSASEDAHVAAFWRIATGGEADPLICTCQEAALQEGWYLRITGAHASAPLDVTGADVESGAAVGSLAITEVTTTVADCLVFYLCATDGGDTNPHAVSGTGWSETTEDSQGGSGGLNMSWGTKDQASAGLTGDATVSWSPNDGASGFQFAIAPAVAAGANPKGPLGMPLLGPFGGPI